MERCPQCGNPRYVCQNEDNDIAFRVYDETCYAMRRKAKYEEGKKDDTKRQGVVVGIEPYTISDTPLSEFRSPHYKKKQKEHAAVVASRTIIPREAPPGATPEAE